MSLYRFTWFGILIFFAAVILFILTEYIAYKLGFDIYLSIPVTKFIITFYDPAFIFSWAIKYYHKYAAVFDVAICICAGGLLSGLLVMGAASIILLNHIKFTDPTVS